MVRGYHVYKDIALNDAMSWRTLQLPARKPSVFAGSFQPLGAADIKALFQRGRRAKRLYFHTVSKTCVAPKGSYSAIFCCLVETLLIASFASRLADEHNFLESGPWGVRYRLKVPVKRHSLPRVFLVRTRVCAHAHYKNLSRFLFSLVDTHLHEKREILHHAKISRYAVCVLFDRK